MAFDRRQKSFGEPTRVRADGTRAESGDDATRPKPANTAYERYKQDLASFFNGNKPLPEHMKDLLATRPGAAEHGLQEAVVDTQPADARKAAKSDKDEAAQKKSRRVINGPSEDILALVDNIRKASSPREVQAAVDALRSKGAALPKDAEVLSKALGHASEEVLTEAMRGLVTVDMAEIKSATLLKTRVKNVMLLTSSSELRELCQQMQSRLA